MDDGVERHSSRVTGGVCWAGFHLIIIYIYKNTGFDGWRVPGVMADQCFFIIISTCSLRWND